MEYRGIEDILKKEEPENEYINRSWSDDPCPVELLRKYNMLHLIRNVEFIHKSESIPSINSEEKYKERYFDLSKKTRVSYKIEDKYSASFLAKAVATELRCAEFPVIS